MPDRWADSITHKWFNDNNSEFELWSLTETKSTAVDRMIGKYWEAFPALQQLFGSKYASRDEMPQKDGDDLDNFVRHRNSVS
jgi:hypothetical protein